jgi:hypothetical protein
LTTEATRALPGLVIARDYGAGGEADHRLAHGELPPM